MGAFFLVDDQGAFAALKEKLRFSEPLQGSRVRQAKKNEGISKEIPLILVDDQGIFAERRASPNGSHEPFHGFSSLNRKEKNTPQGVLFSWWTIRDSNPGPID